MSPFAAGCAICGFDLEEHRRAAEERAAARKVPRAPAVSLPQVRVEDEWLLVGLTALCVAASPLLGIIIALFGLRNPRMANAHPWLIGLIVIAVATLILPPTRYGLLYLLL